jgi:hypothetical protein
MSRIYIKNEIDPPTRYKKLLQGETLGRRDDKSRQSLDSTDVGGTHVGH